MMDKVIFAGFGGQGYPAWPDRGSHGCGETGGSGEDRRGRGTERLTG